MGSTHPREYNWGATWKKCSGSGLGNLDVGIRRAEHMTLFSPQKLALTSLTSAVHSACIVRSRTKTTNLLVIISTNDDELPG
jgi:hypothetical protein